MNNKQIHKSKCVSCGDEWYNRKPTSYPNGVKSIPIITGMQLLSDFGKKRINLVLCNLHANSGLRNITRYLNGTGILQIKNVSTNRWENAEKLGDVV